MELSRQDMKAAPPYRPPGAGGEASGFDKVLSGLMSVLEVERQALEDTSRADFPGLTRQKLQLLMQLDRLAASNRTAGAPESVGEKLVEAKRRLDENARILKLRMDAIREVAELIAEDIRDAESDGTYSVSGAARREYGR